MASRKSPDFIKFKPEIVKAILRDIEQNVPYKIAALARGVHESTFHKWLTIGADDLLAGKASDHAKLIESLNEIKSKRIKNLTHKVEKGKHGHKGAEFILEKVFWKHFSSGGQNRELIEKLEKIEVMLKNKEKEEDNV